MKSKPSVRQHGRKASCALAVLVATFTIGSLTLAATPASASCQFKYVSSDGNHPQVFQIPYNSTCNDLNLGSATITQTYAGFYRIGTRWVQGSGGWITRGPGSGDWRVAIYSIRNGTYVKAVGCCVNAYIWTMS